MDQRKKTSEGYTKILDQFDERLPRKSTEPTLVHSYPDERADVAPRNPIIPKPDINRLRLPPSFGSAFGVKEVLNRVQIRKPGKDEFFRVLESDDWAFLTSIIELKREREIYAVPPEFRNLLPELTKTVLLRCAVTLNAEIFLIAVPQPGRDGRTNPWHTSFAGAVAYAESYWTRMFSDMGQQRYRTEVAMTATRKPAWPDTSMDQLVESAFQGHIIDSPDHFFIKKMKGNF